MYVNQAGQGEPRNLAQPAHATKLSCSGRHHERHTSCAKLACRKVFEAELTLFTALRERQSARLRGMDSTVQQTARPHHSSFEPPCPRIPRPCRRSRISTA